MEGYELNTTVARTAPAVHRANALRLPSLDVDPILHSYICPDLLGNRPCTMRVVGIIQPKNEYRQSIHETEYLHRARYLRASVR
jgi:hypothetical protein